MHCWPVATNYSSELASFHCDGIFISDCFVFFKFFVYTPNAINRVKIIDCLHIVQSKSTVNPKRREHKLLLCLLFFNSNLLQPI